MSKTVTVAQASINGGVPELNVSTVAVSAAFEGGDYDFTYTIIGAVSGGTVSCEADETWITDLDWSKDGAVSFSVDANGDDDWRQGVITLTYTYGSESVSAEVTVIQDFYGAVMTLEDLVGTYEIHGYTYESSGTVAEHTWTAIIYEYSSLQVLIDGLSYKYAGQYPSLAAYVALAELNSAGQLVISAQFTGYKDTTYGWYVGWIPCTKFVDSKWYYNVNIVDCTLTYDPITQIWTSDYGLFIGLFTTDGDVSSFTGTMFDVSNPGFTLKKISNETGASAPASLGNAGSISEDVLDTVAVPAIY